MSGKQNSFGFEIDVRVNADDPPMYVRDTSLSAYRELKDTGELGKQEQRIYQIILKSGLYQTHTLDIMVTIEHTNGQ